MLNTTLLCGGVTAILLVAATTPPTTTPPTTARADATPPDRAAAAMVDRSLLLVLAASDAGIHLVHGSRLPVVAPPADARQQRHRVRLLDAAGATLATVFCAVPDARANVGRCRGPGCSEAHGGAPIAPDAAPAPAPAPEAGPPLATRSVAISVPDVAGLDGIVVEQREPTGWRNVGQCTGADFAALLAAGNQLHGDVTYVGVQGGGR